MAQSAGAESGERRIRNLVAVALLFLGLGFAWFACQLEVETENESLNVPDPEPRDFYAEFRRVFGGDDDLLLALRDPALWSREGLARVAWLTEELARLPGVAGVLSLTTAPRLRRGPAGAEVAPLATPPWDRPELAAEIQAALAEMPEWRDWFLGADGRTTGLVVFFHDPLAGPQWRAHLLEEVRRLSEALAGDDVALHLTGIAVQKQEVTRYVQRDERLLLPLAVLALGATLACFFRHWLVVVLPLVGAGLTVVVVLGGLALLGLRLNAITSLLPPVLLVLAVTPSIHLLQFWWLQATEPDPFARVRQALAARWWPCTLCALTTAAGFAALAWTEMPAVRQFGWSAAIGAMLALVLSLACTAVGLTFVAPARLLQVAPRSHRIVDAFVARCTEWATRAPFVVFSGAVLAGLVLAGGIPRVRNNTDLVRFLGEDAPLRRDTLWIDAHLTGPYPIDFVVRRRDERPLASSEDFQRIDRWQRELRGAPGVRGALSIVDFVRHLYRVDFNLPAPVVPPDDATAWELLEILEHAPNPVFLRRLFSDDHRWLRVHVRLGAVGTQDLQRTAADLWELGRQILGDAYEVRPTGAFYYLARDSNQLVRDQVRSFVTSFVLVALLIGLALRSLTVAALALIPNLLPLLMVGGIMGFIGIDLSTGTAMIAAAALGLVVDDTIHYLAHFHGVFRGDAREALAQTARAVGGALVLNNAVLVAGFWVGIAGSFLPTVYFSFLTGLTMILGLLCDLLVTPACLMFRYGRR